ncbi:MAG: TraB/GumN family protein [Gammaproteobacteria bacterium]
MSTNILPRFRRPLAASLVTLTLICIPALSALAQPLPLWRVSDGAGHTLYLAGSMHALKTDDYPLPAPFKTAFDHCRRLVEELDLDALTPAQIQNAVTSFGMLPTGKTLADAMGADWAQAQKLAAKADINLEIYLPLKPWFAAVRISGQVFVAAGYIPSLGLDRHFANLAAQRKIPVIGLETLDEQMGFFNDLRVSVQRQFLLQALEEVSHDKQELAGLHAAWRDGDMSALAALADKDFADYPKLRAGVLDDRNRRWLPVLENCLSEDKGCYVVVGAEHMIGPNGLLALLGKAGFRVVQLQAASAPPATSAGS